MEYKYLIPQLGKMNRLLILLIMMVSLLSACGSLEKKSVLVNVGDPKARVQSVMGTPDDRQLKGQSEAWQYCETGAGFGYHDYRIVWFQYGKVTGMNSYKSSRAGSSCASDLKPINWESAPDAVVEIRNR